MDILDFAVNFQKYFPLDALAAIAAGVRPMDIEVIFKDHDVWSTYPDIKVKDSAFTQYSEKAKQDLVLYFRILCEALKDGEIEPRLTQNDIKSIHSIAAQLKKRVKNGEISTKEMRSAFLKKQYSYILHQNIKKKRCPFSSHGVMALFKKAEINDEYFNRATVEPEAEITATATTTEPEPTVTLTADDSKGKATKAEKNGWSLPWADLEYDDETGADKFDEERYAKYYTDHLQKQNVTEQEGRVYIMRHDCKLSSKKISFGKIGERLGISGERARKLYGAADGKIKLFNEAKSKADVSKRFYSK